MTKDFEIVVFQLKREDDGLFVATSRDLAGVCVTHRNRDRIIEDMPNIVRLWFRRNRNIEVEVFWGKHTEADDTFSFPTIAIPAEIAAQALQR